MISNEQIRQTINDCSKVGYSVGMRDISYILLCRHYEDTATAYRILFGLDADFNPEYSYIYDQTASIKYLREYINSNFIEATDKSTKKKKKKIDAEDDISFEENKAEIINLIKQTKEAFKKGEIEAKDALKIEADLRVKLNDKFGANEEIKEQVVHVFEKYNDICPYCSHEISRRAISKEEAIKLYDLKEK